MAIIASKRQLILGDVWAQMGEPVMGCAGGWLGAVLSAVSSFGTWLVALADAAAWPLVIGIALYWFRAQIAHRIKTDKFTARKGDMEVVAQPDPNSAAAATGTAINFRALPPTVQAGGAPDGIALPADVSDAQLFPASVMERERIALRRALESAPPEERDLWVKRCLMEARVLVLYATINNSIFQSQIDGLRELVARGGTASLADAKAFYEGVREKWPDVHRTGFDGWVSYLTRGNLVVLRDDTVTITDLGRGFLEYLRIAFPTQIKAF